MHHYEAHDRLGTQRENHTQGAMFSTNQLTTAAIRTRFLACSSHSGSSCLMSNTGAQHCVLSENLAVQCCRTGHTLLSERAMPGSNNEPLTASVFRGPPATTGSHSGAKKIQFGYRSSLKQKQALRGNLVHVFNMKANTGYIRLKH